MSMELHRVQSQLRQTGRGSPVAGNVTRTGELTPTLAVQDANADDAAESLYQERAIEALPPCDTGREAWQFLLGCFMIEAALWGT